MTRRGPFPSPADKPMNDRDDEGFAQHGPATGIPWSKPEPEPEGPKELDEVTARNIRKAFE